jgi:hypothetical protein
MRKAVKAVTKYIHAVLILSLITPLLYAIAMPAESYDAKWLYAAGMFIILPVLAAGISAERCRSLVLYLVICLAASVLAVELANQSGAVLLADKRWGYVLFMAAEAFWVSLENFLQRLSRDKEVDSETYQPDWKPREGIFEKPKVGVLLYFVGIYIAGLLLVNSALCDQALAGGILYLFSLVLYGYVESTEQYLSLHNRVSALPARRIYGIKGSLVAAFLAILMLLSVMALSLRGYRQYTDVREWKTSLEIEVEPSAAEEMVPDGGGTDMVEALPFDTEETEPLPAWVDMLFRLLAALLLAAAFVGVLLIIRDIFRRFRDNYEENGDIVEDLTEVSDIAEKIKKEKRQRHFRSEREQVRYQYRRFIKKHRKGKPAAYETPHEIETLAQVADSPEGIKMHALYEEARYGREPAIVQRQQSSLGNPE